MKTVNIQIGDLFNAIKDYENYNFEYDKKYSLKTDIKTLDENGNWVKVKSLIKKNKNARKITFLDNRSLVCSDKHLICIDKKNCKYAKDLKKGEKILDSNNKKIEFSSFKDIGKIDLFDFEIDSESHLYQTTNKLIHHNTSMAEYISGQFQKRDIEYLAEKGEFKYRKGVVLYIDAEHAIDPLFAKIQGFDMSKAILSQPDSGEQALDIAIEAAESGAVDLIVIDSLAALTPQAELDGEMGDQQMGLQARLISKFCRKIKSILALNGCTLIAINQIRMKIGGWGNPECVTPDTLVEIL